MYNKLAIKLNDDIISSNPNIYEMLSSIGRNLFFPKGILSQSAEASIKAKKINATIGIAKENESVMTLESIISQINNIKPEQSITYAPSYGILSLREKWKNSLYKKNPSLKNKTISLPIVTCGITHGINTFANIWLNPDDVVILPNMTWGNYNMALSILKNARLSRYQMFSKEGFFNLKEFSKKLEEESNNSNKITVLLNFPHNPSGYSISKIEAFKIVDLMKKIADSGTKIIALCDDAYFGLFYENESIQESIFSILCNCHENLLAVKVDGATKEEFAWGLRIGFITYGCTSTSLSQMENIYASLESKTAGCIRGTISNASHLSQTLLLKSLDSKSSIIEKKEKFLILQSRAKLIKEILSKKDFHNILETYSFNSGYFMCIKLKSVNAHKLRTHLLEEYSVGIISVDDENIRIAYSCVDIEDIPELFRIIRKAILDIQS